MNFRTFKLLHLLSLDVVLGAAGGYAFACKALLQPVSFYFVTVLAVSVWIIYLADHMLDSLKIPYSPRYKLFSRHKPALTAVLTGLLLLDVTLVIRFLPAKFTHYGIILGAFLIFYLAGQHFLRGRVRTFFPKEILISLIYILAVWLYPLLHTVRISSASALFMLLHFMLVLTNVLIFSFFEKEEDIKNGKISFFSGMTDGSFRRVIAVLCVVSFMLALFIGLNYRFPLMIIILAIISTIYWFEISFSGHRLIKKFYPAITDGIFLLFLLYLL